MVCHACRGVLSANCRTFDDVNHRLLTVTLVCVAAIAFNQQCEQSYPDRCADHCVVRTHCPTYYGQAHYKEKYINYFIVTIGACNNCYTPYTTLNGIHLQLLSHLLLPLHFLHSSSFSLFSSFVRSFALQSVFVHVCGFM